MVEWWFPHSRTLTVTKRGVDYASLRNWVKQKTRLAQTHQIGNSFEKNNMLDFTLSVMT